MALVFLQLAYFTQNNCRIVKKEIEDTNTWIPRSWIGRISIIKISILPKTIYRFNTIPIKTPMASLTELEQIFQNFYGPTKDPK